MPLSPMIDVRPLSVDEITSRMDQLAALRMGILRGWPYLYDSDLAYERAYLSPYRDDPRALVIGALVEGRLVGVSGAIPLEAQSDHVRAAFDASGVPADSILFGGESLVLPLYQRRGLGRRIFDQRENWARILGRRHVAFCSVVRPDDHPGRPDGERRLDGFWTRCGYRPLPGAVIDTPWRDLGCTEETTKQLQCWMCTLP